MLLADTYVIRGTDAERRPAEAEVFESCREAGSAICEPLVLVFSCLGFLARYHGR
jgi:hypothetical protein